MAQGSFKIRVTPRRFRSKRLIGSLRKLGGLEAVVHRVGKRLRAEVRRNLSGKILQRRTGKLWSSWDFRKVALSDGWRVVVGSDVVYARIHEKGGMAGRGHRTRIPKRRYATRALVAQKDNIRKAFRKFLAKVASG